MGNNAEHQAAWRARRQQRIAELEARVAELEAENECLRKDPVETDTDNVWWRAICAARANERDLKARAKRLGYHVRRRGDTYTMTSKDGARISSTSIDGLQRDLDFVEYKFPIQFSTACGIPLWRANVSPEPEALLPPAAGDLSQRAATKLPAEMPAAREPGFEPGQMVSGIIRGFNSRKNYFVVEDPGPLGDGDRKVKVQPHRGGDPIGDPVIVLGSQIVPSGGVSRPLPSSIT